MSRSAFALALLACSVVSAAPPNVVVILADDLGWGDLSGSGNTNLKTPHIDSLATDGATFERFFVQPVCSPTRAEFLTGRSHVRGGVRGVTSGGERLDLDETTLADCFKKAGYATACFGKWHNGSQHPYHPTARGFDEFFGFTHGHLAHYFDSTDLDHNGQPATGNGYLPDEIAGRAIDWFGTRAKAGKPFFAYLAFNTPHSPMQVPDRYWDRFKAAELKRKGRPAENVDHTRAALAMTENLDDNVGRVLDALKKQKLDANTLVLFFSDNGPNGARWVGGMKGQKGSTDDGGVRSVLHVRWNGAIKPGTVVKPVAGAIDLMPTLLGLCGVKNVGKKTFDGIDLSRQLLDANPPAVPERFLIQTWNGKHSVRSDRYRLDATGKLFDMTADPGQTSDLSAKEPVVLKKHQDALAAWKEDVLAELPAKDDRPHPVGFTARTELPARDGVGVGGVKRSASAPNSSYFTHWAKADDAMTWQVEVREAGEYELIVQYTCAKADVGSTLVAKLGDAAWAGKVEMAADPPPVGKEADRVVRQGESYTKPFAALSLGVARVAKGTGTLTLSAKDIRGAQVADVRGVELVRKR
jgi:arylsulfatase A-like enzyme